MTSINIKSASVNQSMDVSNEKKPLKSSLHKTSHSVGAKKSTDPSSIIHATNVRFSASFLSPERSSMNQIGFIEMYNSPSMEIPSKEKIRENIYKQQFDKNILKDFLSSESKIRNKIKHMEIPTSEDLVLKSSRIRKLENQQLRNELQQAHELRENLKFLGKRERILKNAWKHGVMGYQLPQEADYKDNSTSQKVAGNTTMHLTHGEGHQSTKNRVFGLQKILGTHTQIGFCNDNVFKSQDDKSFDFDSAWRRKKIVLNNRNNPKNTKERIFVPESYTPKIDRLTHLALRSTGFKNFNILNNTISILPIPESPK